eukprot:GDKI01018952.1.p1 GENE.GDKI01018952.1~~GDKI01018952.1.p1  ORF type:complete len:220 (+),score=43.48 GDKI01018952.1:80-739(+)
MLGIFDPLSTFKLVLYLCLQWMYFRCCIGPNSAFKFEQHEKRGNDLVSRKIMFFSVAMFLMIYINSVAFFFPQYRLLFHPPAGDHLNLPGYMRPWYMGDWMAATVALTGGLLRLWAFETLGHFFTYEVTIRKDHKLVSSGPYRLLMHPSYTGFLLLVVGLTWLSGWQWSVWFLWVPGVTLTVCALVARVHSEEAALAGEFKGEWERYAAVRWRLVPYVW